MHRHWGSEAPRGREKGTKLRDERGGFGQDNADHEAPIFHLSGLCSFVSPMGFIGHGATAGL